MTASLEALEAGQRPHYYIVPKYCILHVSMTEWGCEKPFKIIPFCESVTKSVITLWTRVPDGMQDESWLVGPDGQTRRRQYHQPVRIGGATNAGI